MRRTRLYQILICLLCLSPTWSLAQTLTQYEYWFDDDFSARQTVGLSGYEADIDVGIDASSLGNGLHKFSLRLQQSDGMFSPVTTGYFFTAPQVSNGGKLEYWFDDDWENVNTIDGKVSSDGEGLIFNSALDLKAVSEGSHRMYYRLIDSKGKPNSAVSMTPLMVKSKYLSEAKTSKVVSYSVSVDDQTPVIMDVLNPSEEVTIPHSYDARALKAGEHSVKTTVWNSMGTATTDKTKFNVVSQETPIIKLEVSEEKGIVTARFNSIPNDLYYRIIRQDENGNQAKIGEFRVSYPNAISKTDEPVEGSYIYHVQAIYTDYSGEKCLVKSNEAEITVAKVEDTAEPKVTLGSIIGRINIDNQQVAFMPLNLQMDVTFSDGVVIKSGANGIFIRDGIPVGTELSMTVKNNDNYTFTSPSVVVDENTHKNIYVINATPVENQVVEKSNDSYDLVINSDITGIPNYFNFEVKNATDKKWSGLISLIAVKEKEDKNSKDALSFATLKSYHRVGAISISDLNSGASQSVELKVTDFPVISKNTFYNFYLVSESKGANGVYKPLEPIGNVVMNPRRIEIEKTQGTSVGTSEAEIEQAVNDILSTMKDYKEYGGYLANALSFYAKTGDLNAEDAKALAAFVKDLKEHLKGVGDIASFVSDVKKYYEGYKIYRDWNTMDDFDKFVLITNKIFEWSGPCGKIYQTYLTVLERCKDAIDKILKEWFPYDLTSVYCRNQMKFHIKVIKKDKSWGMKSYYSGNEIFDAIKTMEIKMFTPMDKWYNNYYTTPNLKSNELVMTKNDNAAEQKYSTFSLEGMKFYMKINWKNGRTTVVPLLSKELVKYSSNTEVTVTFKSESSEMADIIHLVPVE